MYERAITLKSKGLSQADIGRELGVTKDLVGYWLRGAKPQRVWRHEPDLRPSRDLAYLAGFYIGDGKYAGDEHKVRFELADRAQSEIVNAIVGNILGQSPKPLGRDGPFYTVQYDSVVLSDFLNQEVQTLTEYLKEFATDFLQGFFDAEGYASCWVNLAERKIPRMTVGVANTNVGYLRCVGQLLARYGFPSSFLKTNRAGQEMTIRGKTWTRKHDVYHIQISNNSAIIRFQDEVGFRNPAKADKLSSLVEMAPMKPEQRFVWFTARYARKGRKWLRIEGGD